MASWIGLLTAAFGVVGKLLSMKSDGRDEKVARLTFMLDAFKEGRENDLQSINDAYERARSDPRYGRVRPVQDADG